MKKIAIIGAGPTGIYTLFSLLKQGEPLDVSIYEQAEEAGVGMPYSDEENSRMMLANIASIEIPPIQSTYLDWLKAQSRTHLARYGVDYDALHDRQFLPRILLGEYFRDQFLRWSERPGSRAFASGSMSPAGSATCRRPKKGSDCGSRMSRSLKPLTSR